MARILYPEFRDEQEFSRYPFADTATLRTTGGIEISAETFLDASLFPIGSRGPLYLAAINVTAREIAITVGDTAGSLCSGAFDPLDPPRAIELSDIYGRAAGLLVSEPLRLAAFAAWPTGQHTFLPTAAEFVASVAIPTPEIGLRGILTEQGELLTGDVWLVGDRGVVVREDGEGVIRIDIVGDPLFARRLCLPINFVPPQFLQTINHCPPDEYGNFNLTIGDHIAPDTILRVYPIEAGLRIEAVGQLAKGGNNDG